LRSQAQEYAIVIPTRFEELYGWTDCIDGFSQTVKQTSKIHYVPVRAIVALSNVERKNAASDTIDTVWLLNNRVDLDIYSSVDQVTMPE